MASIQNITISDSGEDYIVQVSQDAVGVTKLKYLSGDVSNEYEIGDSIITTLDAPVNQRNISFFRTQDDQIGTFILTTDNDSTSGIIADIYVFRTSEIQKRGSIRFDGYNHPSLPPVSLDFSCKNEGSSTQPEAIVDVKHEETWTRLPITEVETRVNKDGAADLAATSRVSCPTTWGESEDGEGKVPIYEYVGEANKSDDEPPQFDTARVMYWNEYSEEYTVESFGYVASVGPSAQNGVFQFYVYDASDLMNNISVTKSYDGPTAQQVADFVAFDPQYGLEINSPIPIIGVSVTAPREERDVEGFFESTTKQVVGWVNEDVPILKYPQSIFEGTEGFREWLDDSLKTGGHKHFRKNRHTLTDVMVWLTSEIGGSWYFEPTAEGVILVVNNGAADDYKIARSAYYDGQFDPDGLDYIQGFNPVEVDVLNNNSLEDLKPINYLELNGETAESYLLPSGDRAIVDGPITSPKEHTRVFPHVEVTYPPLLERAGGRKLGPRPIEAGTSTLDEARQQAVRRFKERHEDNTDGSIEIKALPSIRPYDYVAAIPVCNDTFDAGMNPIQYEVNSVRHQVTADEPYTTSLGVSLALDENQLEVTAEFENINEQ